MKIALLPNLTREKAKDVTLDITMWLKKYNAEYGTLSEYEGEFSKVQGMNFALFDDLLNWCDAVISIGGDGSMLNAAKNTVDYGKPILCINAGRLAFMAGLESDELELLKCLIDGDYEIEPRMLVDVKIMHDGEVIAFEHCINDVVVARGATLKMTELDINCDDRLINSYRADGVIVATPTGSSAYSLSAGGPVIDPSIEAIVVTPICPQSLFARSVVFGADNKIEVCCSEKSTNTDLYVAFDGDKVVSIKKGDIISVKKSDKYAKFIRIKREEFYEILNKKLAGIEGKI